MLRLEAQVLLEYHTLTEENNNTGTGWPGKAEPVQTTL